MKSGHKTGARQVGKTFVIREYAKKHFKYVIDNVLYLPIYMVGLLEKEVEIGDIVYVLDLSVLQ